MRNLIQKVVAQSEPTFPYEGPFEGPSTPTSTTTTTTTKTTQTTTTSTPPPTTSKADVKLVAETTSLQIGDTTTCDIYIESDDANVSSYSISISFNASVLEVVDSNSSQSGIQTYFVDNFSTVNENSADNLSGTITLRADISGDPQTVNRRIAQITFRAKSTGTANVSVSESSSSVSNASGENIIGSTSELTFTVTGQTTTTSAPPEQLPESGIFDSFTTIGSVFAGVLLLAVGIKAVAENITENKSMPRK